MKKHILFLVILLFSVLIASAIPAANLPSILGEEDDEGPIYIVQPGDTLAGIALQFGVDIDELIAVNDIENPNALPIGARLILPGLEGISGVLTTVDIGLGENLQTLSIRYGVSQEVLKKINKLSSSVELYYGANIIVPLVEDETQTFIAIATGSTATTLLEKSVKQNTNEWAIVKDNQADNTWAFLPQQILFQEIAGTADQPMLPSITGITVTPEQIYQGNLLTVSVEVADGFIAQGAWNGRELPFYPEGGNTFTALQGINALHPVGLNELRIGVTGEGQEAFIFEQHFLTYETYYNSESITVPPLTLDPVIQEQEDKRIDELVSIITETKYWNGPFGCVVDQPICIYSRYGTNRNYNAGTYFSFHSGIDYGVCATLNIYAPADGVVVLADELTIRGNATYIDHGYGVFSAFFHQSEIWVKEGDFVKAGDIIGQIGTTGRSTGPHLHYDLIINGEQINPLIWLPLECQ